MRALRRSRLSRVGTVLVATLVALTIPAIPSTVAGEPVAAPAFSHDRGFYAEPISVTLSSATPGAQIRYTTTGKAPTATSGTIYSVPVTISKPTVLRAIAYRAGLDDSPVESRSYIFPTEVLKQPKSVAGYGRPFYSLLSQHDYGMDQSIVNNPAYSAVAGPALQSIPTISIAVDPADIMRNGRLGEVPMWGNPGFYDGLDVSKPMSVELIDPAHPTSNGQALGMVKGHSEVKLKRSLRLKFSANDGPGYPKNWATSLFRNAPLNGDSAAQKAKTVVLRAGKQSSWTNSVYQSTFTEDQWFRDTQIAASGFGSHGTFVHLYINGLYWGLYNAVERPDEDWQAEYFGGDDDDYFALADDGPDRPPVWDGDPARYKYLTEDLLMRDLSHESNYSELKEYLDVATFADYLAIEFYIQNTDWPNNNFKGGNRNVPAGPMRWFAWDGEASWRLQGAWVPPVFRPDAAPSAALLPTLWHALRSNAEFMLTFADRVQRLTSDDGALTDAQALARWDVLNTFIHDAVVDESARWGDSFKATGVPTRTRDKDWQRDVDRVRALTVGNAARLVAALRSNGYFPAIDAPSVDPSGGVATPGQLATMTNPNAGGTIYYTADGSDPRATGGAVSAAATQYTAPVDVSTPTRVRARVLDGSTWSAETDRSWEPAAVPPLRITELSYNPKKVGAISSDELEFVEIQNVGDAPVDLTGVTITDAVSFDFTGSAVTSLAPGELVVVARTPASFAAVYGTLPNVVGPYSGKLSNDGELVRLRARDGRVIQDFTYSPTWYPTTSGGGYTLAIRDALADPAVGSTPQGWRPSSQLGGTPGAVDDVSVVSADPTTVIEGDEGVTQMTFRVWIDRSPVAPVTVAYAAADGTATSPGDFAATTGQVTFDPSGPAEHFVTVDVNGDHDPEADENFTLGLSVDSGPAAIGASGIGTIVNDDDFPVVSIADAAATEGTAADTTMSFPVTIDRPITAPVTVKYRTRDITATAPADYAAATGTIQFTPEGPQTQDLAVTIAADSSHEPTEQFEVLLSEPVGAALGSDRGVGTITDDENSGIVATIGGTAKFQDVVTGKQYTFTASVPSKADAFGNRGSIWFYGAGAPVDGQYAVRNSIVNCGAGCTVGSSWAFFKPTLGWRVDNSTTPATITVGKYSGPVTTGAITITYAP